MKKPVLSLDFEPDEYLCTWHIRDGAGAVRNLSGAIEVSPMAPPRGIIYGNIPLTSDTRHGETSFAFPQRSASPATHATLANGGEVLVLDSTITWWMSHGNIRGSAALLRRKSTLFPWQHSDVPEVPDGDDHLVFDRVRFQVGALDAVLGFAPLKTMRFPKPGEDGERTWAATEADETAVRWTSGEDVLEAHYRGSASIADPYSFSVRHSPVITASSAHPLSLRRLVDDWVTPVQAIASIATGTSEPLTYLAVESNVTDGEAHRWQVFGSGISQDPFDSNAESVRKANSALLCVADAVDLLELVQKWQGLAADHHPLVETYAAMLHARDQHPRSRFLLLVQSLEGMHGHETQTEFEGLASNHSAMRAEVLAEIKASVSTEHFKYIKKYLLKQPFRSLESALRATFTDLPVDRTDALSRTALIRQLMDEGPSGMTPFAAAARLRHLLAHGVRGFDTSDINQVVSVSEEVVRAHALRLLGCPDFVLERVLDE
ncbi:hypothetical protein EXE58_06075 [Nocardioides seonyuensis]|uniref:ApeA N-terminal domain-containing protein n=1 Tax=Nocardioides seonyuensis TaxID=2518371 RepID=A0A4P7IES3_9ACTN|nr:hypothetical protein [Nocardioides seonyuensis]QBX55063.1 hypothetical protein EXE58_06075 [Nocardioides seonyuensis]